MNKPGYQSTSGRDRRRSVRYACILGAVDVNGQSAFMPVQPLGWPIRVVDISRHGIGIHAGDQLDEGSLLTISLFSRLGKPSAPRQVRIVRAAQQADGTWIGGAAFIEPIDEDELRILLRATDDSQ
jgi:hypothetical protein